MPVKSVGIPLVCNRCRGKAFEIYTLGKQGFEFVCVACKELHLISGETKHLG